MSDIEKPMTSQGQKSTTTTTTERSETCYHTEECRRRFCSADPSRRTREVKIHNTTTITTSCSAATTCHDSRIFVDRDGKQIEINPSSDDTTAQESIQINNLSENGTASRRTQSAAPHSPTHAGQTLPIKRNIRFVYGDDQNQRPIHVVDECGNGPQNLNVNTNIAYYASNPVCTRINGIPCDQQLHITESGNTTSNYTSLPIRQQTYSTHIPANNGYVTTGTPYYYINESGSGPRHRSHNTYEHVQQRSNIQHRSHQDSSSSSDPKKMRVRDVEVECEIDEDPSIFEGSEGYVKSLINKIQTQYKNPETVHIKITRRQKPENMDKSGNLMKTPNESYGQIVRKEYYTIRSAANRKNRSSISSFVDTSNIPYIDDECDSRNNSIRNSRAFDDRYSHPHYVIEKHIIYDDDCKKKKKKKGNKNLIIIFCLNL
jgi:hypothetical protein